MVSFSWLPLVGRTIACPTAVLLIWVEAKNKRKQKHDVSIAAFCYFQRKVGKATSWPTLWDSLHSMLVLVCPIWRSLVYLISVGLV